MVDAQIDMDANISGVKHVMHINLLSLGTAGASLLTGLLMTLAELEGLVQGFTLLEKAGIPTLVGIGSYVVIRWLLRERQKHEDRINKMHEERVAMIERHHAEVVAHHEEVIRRLETGQKRVPTRRR